MRLGRMAALIPSTVRSPFPRARWTRPPGRTSTTPRRSARSARTRNGAIPTTSSASIPGAPGCTLAFAEQIDAGIDIRPSIAITKARLTLGEIRDAIADGRLKVDGEIVHEAGDVSVTKIAVDPVWWLPGVAERFGVAESGLRRCLLEQTGRMDPAAVTRPAPAAVLAPIGGMTLYI